jgi:organic radical activating enzyme
MTSDVPFDYPHSDQLTNQLSILEIYAASGQGEGFYAGVPSIFVRTNYCPVGCHFCDTKYSWNSRSARLMTIQDILSEIVLQGDHIKHVVLTGGEPFSQPLPAVYSLLEKLHQRGYQITVETSGIVNPFIADNRFGWKDLNILYSISPKLSSSKSRFEVPSLGLWTSTIRPDGDTRKMQFKFVISDLDEDYDETLRAMKSLLFLPPSMVRNLWIILQPVTTNEKTIDDFRSTILDRQLILQERLMMDRSWAPYVRMGITVTVRCQSHVLLYGSRRLV